jgi:hypothetical protein
VGKADRFGWVFLFAGYYAWRKEALENRNSVEITLQEVRPYFGELSTGETHVTMRLILAIWNSTDKPTIVTGWRVTIPALGIVRDPLVISDDEISTKPIAAGARTFCDLRLTLKDQKQSQSEETTRALRDDPFDWLVSFRDVKQREHHRTFSIPALGSVRN